MKKNLIILAAALTLTLRWSIPACAQPEIMPDGTVFDAEYYAQANPNVVAIWGTDANVLYLHYTQLGKAEGRLATNPAAVTAPAAPLITPASAAQGQLDSFEHFNYEYYMRANDDVLQIVGINPPALYQHYVEHCQADGRLYNGRTREDVTNELIQKYGLHVWNDFGDWFVYLGTSFDDIPPEGYTGEIGYDAQRQAILDRYMKGGSVITSAPSKGVGGETLYCDNVYAWFVYIKPVPQGVKDFILNYGTPGLFYNHGYDSYFTPEEIHRVQN